MNKMVAADAGTVAVAGEHDNALIRVDPTGLGLAIVKHIALIHGARIKLESQVDVGTTITVTFPTAS